MSTTEAGRRDWHFDDCGQYDGQNLDGSPLAIPCDCGLPEAFAEAATAERTRILDALTAAVEGLPGRRAMIDRQWWADHQFVARDAVIAAIEAQRKGGAE